MADADFEARLGRWFAETPHVPDADAFAQRVERRLDRAWRLRGALISAAGLAGGVVAAAQMLGNHVFQGAAAASARSIGAMTKGAAVLGDLRQLASLPEGSEVLWVGAGLAVVAVVFFAARALEEF